MKTIFLLLFLAVSLSIFAREEPIVLKTATGQIYGTLLLPETGNTFPVVLLIAGSGPTDRDGNSPSMRNNTLKMLANGLAEKGIASVRYDKRGIAQSVSAGPKEEDLRFDDYVKDAQGWVEMLKADKRFKQIILAGHSEGSLIGILAARNNPSVSQFISLAGAGESAGKILRQQLSTQPKQVQDICFPIISLLEKGDTVENVSPMLYSLFRPSVQPYMISWLKYDPVVEIGRLKIPVLVVQGNTDIQVKENNATLLATACPGAQKKIIPDMNHVLKKCQSTDHNIQIATYTNPELPLHESIVNVIADFITANKKK